MLVELAVYNTAINQTCLDTAPTSETEMDFQCAYPPAVLPVVETKLCEQFQPLGCCMGTLVTMGQQEEDSIIPPCILQILANCPVAVTVSLLVFIYLQNGCMIDGHRSNVARSCVCILFFWGGSQASDFCTTGLMTNVSLLVATYKFVQNDADTFILPNMYNETDVRKLMDAFARAMNQVPVSPEMFTVTNFSYKDAAGNPISGYAQVNSATSATYSVQLSVIASQSPEVIGVLHPFVPTDFFAEKLAAVYGIGDAVEATSLGAEYDFFIVPMQYLPDTAPMSGLSIRSALCITLFAMIMSFLP